jgi:hypothetical protein
MNYYTVRLIASRTTFTAPVVTVSFYSVGIEQCLDSKGVDTLTQRRELPADGHRDFSLSQTMRVSSGGSTLQYLD